MMGLVKLLVLLLVVGICDCADDKSASDILDDLVAGGYKKWEPPNQDQATEVKLGMYINSFYSINEQTMDYSMSFYLRQSWNDPRVTFEPIGGKIDKIRIFGTDRIWTPDTFFRNEKNANFHDVTVENALVTIKSNGDVWYVAKVSATFSCPMKLQKYPLDVQHCPIMFESFGYTMDTMYFSWLPSPLDLDPAIKLPQFTLADEILYDCSQNYTAGAFPCLEIKFVLRRDVGYFLIQFYIPSILIVIVSWVTFWLHPEATTARALLGIMTVLTMTTQTTAARASLPRVSYVTAMDIWFSTVLFLVFGSLVEFSVVNVLSRMSKSGSSDKTEDNYKMTQMKGDDTETQVPNDGKKDKALLIDKFSRIIFPLLFLLFNIIYWTLYRV